MVAYRCLNCVAIYKYVVLTYLICVPFAVEILPKMFITWCVEKHNVLLRCEYNFAIIVRVFLRYTMHIVWPIIFTCCCCCCCCLECGAKSNIELRVMLSRWYVRIAVIVWQYITWPSLATRENNISAPLAIKWRICVNTFQTDSITYVIKRSSL